MKISNFKSGQFQTYGASGYRYFLPSLINRVFEVDDIALQRQAEVSARLLGELNGMGKLMPNISKLVPNIELFIASSINSEATQSSRIEGIQTEVSDTFIPKEYIFKGKDDWEEVMLYVDSMKEAIVSLKTLPISNRLIKQAHKTLLSSGRGSKKMPGEIRTSQNWIGGTKPSDAIFVPPHQQHVGDLMSDLEKFLNDDVNSTPHLIKIGIAHYQFETIHPFLDGNGRIGRMLIPLYLIQAKWLSEPLLHMSAFFEANKNTYYNKLENTRTNNALSDWLLFFLIGIEKSARHGIGVLTDILQLQKTNENIINSSTGARRHSNLKLLDILFKIPFIKASDVSRELGVSPATANKIISDLIRLEILSKFDKKQKRNRLFVFKPYLDILDKPFD